MLEDTPDCHGTAEVEAPREELPLSGIVLVYSEEVNIVKEEELVVE